jgi:hypothetical protein
MCGFIAHVEDIAPEGTSSHCITHCHALAVRKILNALKMVLDEAKVVNLRKSRPLNSRTFNVHCDEVGSSYTMLLLHMKAEF